MSDRPKTTEYLDFRGWLQAFLAWREREDLREGGPKGRKTWTVAWLAARLGCTEPHARNILSGNRPVSDATLGELINIENFEPEEIDFLRASIIFFRDTSTVKERADALKVLLKHGIYDAFKQVDAQTAWFWTSATYLTIWQLAAHRNFRDDPRWVADQVRPKISVVEAGEALDRMKAGGLLERRDGRLRQSTPRMVGGALSEAAFYELSQQLLQRALDLHEHFPAKERFFPILVESATARQKARVREEMRDFIKRVHAILAVPELTEEEQLDSLRQEISLRDGPDGILKKRTVLERRADQDEPQQVVAIMALLFPLTDGADGS